MTTWDLSHPLAPSRVRPPRESAAVDQRAVRNGRWLIAFVLVEFVMQAGLWFFGDSTARLAIRIGCYVPSLAYLFYFRGTGKLHPAAWWIQFVIGILAIAMLNPDGGGLFASIGQVALYLSVLSPLLWAGRMQLEARAFRIILLMMWAFYVCSASLGVLQIQYPGRYDGALSANYDQTTIVPHVLTRADGTKFIRPKGLSDTPGGAAAGGVYAIILGIGLLLTEPGLIVRALAIVGFVIGLFCIYICQGRTNLIIVALAGISVFAVLIRRGSMGKVFLLAIIFCGVAIVGTSLAFAIGGKSTIDRFATLTDDDPQTVFYDNRGKFLDTMISEDLMQFPLGAGVGRWGMMSFYFGNPNDALWAEMMWQALLYDGGVPLIIVYICLLAVLLQTSWRLAAQISDARTAGWAAMVFGHTVAAIAASFVFPIFSMQLGMDVMLLNAAVFAVHRTELLRQTPEKR